MAESIRVEIRGLEKVNRFFAQLPINLNKEISKSSERFMRDVKKSAKLRAPRDTGKLANSIIVRKTKIKGLSNQWKLVVDSPYGIFQERGFKPHTFFLSSSTNKLQGGKFYFVRRYKPFVAPALEMNLSRLSTSLANSTKNAISRSRKRN